MEEKSVTIPDRMFFKIGEVASLAKLQPYVLRYWETEFPLLSPSKTNSQQRMYTRADVQNVLLIKHLLYEKRFSIEGARKHLSELRRSGQLVAARTSQKTSHESPLFEQAKKELREIIDLCRLDC